MTTMMEAMKRAGFKEDREHLEEIADRVVAEAGERHTAIDSRRFFDRLVDENPDLLYKMIAPQWIDFARSWLVAAHDRKDRAAAEGASGYLPQGQGRGASSAENGACAGVSKDQESGAPAAEAGHAMVVCEDQRPHARPAAPSARPETLAGLRAVASLTRSWLLEEAERFARAQLGKRLGSCVRDEVNALRQRSGKLGHFLGRLESRMQPGATSVQDQLGAEEIAALARASEKENVHA